MASVVRWEGGAALFLCVWKTMLTLSLLGSRSIDVARWREKQPAAMGGYVHTLLPVLGDLGGSWSILVGPG